MHSQHSSLLSPSASIGGSGSLLMPSLMRPTMAPQAAETNNEAPNAGGFAPAVVAASAPAPAPAASSAVDETQVMTKLQQLMNQMGTFMKSVDARLTTLEKMTGQLMTSHSEQAKSMELRFQEIAQLIQQKSSIIQLPPQGGQHPSPAHAHPGFGVPSVPAPAQSFGGSAAGTTAGSASADYELARQLQEQFDRESQQQQQQQVARPGQPLYAPMGAAPMVPGMGLPTQPNLAALQMQQFQQQQQRAQPAPAPGKPDPKQLSSCPICSIQKPLGEMEEHVNQHFDENEGVVADALDQSKAKQPNRGFWDRLFGAEDEPAQPPTPSTPGAAPYPGQMVMYPTGAHPGAGAQPMYGYAAAYPQQQYYRR